MGGKVLLIGRVVFSFFFIYSGFNHLTKLSMYSQFAGAQWGSLLIAAFLIPAAFTVHKFWGIADPMMAANQAAHFWKNIALTGACLMFYGLATLYPGRWPYSIGRSTPASTI